MLFYLMKMNLKIKKQNRNIALEMSLDKNIEKFNDILTKFNSNLKF